MNSFMTIPFPRGGGAGAAPGVSGDPHQQDTGASVPTPNHGAADSQKARHERTIACDGRIEAVAVRIPDRRWFPVSAAACFDQREP